MLLSLAWRNIWRHKLRSLVVIMSISTGLWAGVFMMAFSWGMYRQYMKEAIETQFSHIQIHEKAFDQNDRESRFALKDHKRILHFIDSLDALKAVSDRTISAGMASSPAAASGVSIIGIMPESENSLTALASRVIEGQYPDSGSKNQILIGKKLAEKLKVRLKNKVVLTFQDTAGEMVAAAFRICGIYRSGNSGLDGINVYVRQQDLGKLLNAGASVHEIALLLKLDAQTDAVGSMLKARFPGLSVKTWNDMAPELDLIVSSFNEYMYIFVGFILLALTFGIVNTMLMAVLERIREIGMLMAIGMNKTRIFLMIIIETIYLCLLGGPFGLLIAYLSVRYTGKNGIDLSRFSEGLSNFGFSHMVYPELENIYYLNISLMTVVTAILSAIYPAIKAIRLNPASAIRKI